MLGQQCGRGQRDGRGRGVGLVALEGFFEVDGIQLRGVGRRGRHQFQAELWAVDRRHNLLQHVPVLVGHPAQMEVARCYHLYHVGVVGLAVGEGL